jgi:hypothetical protein
MPLEKLHSFLKKKDPFYEGYVYILTGGKHLIEAAIYSGTIINVKSLALPHEQIIQALLTDDISEVNESTVVVKHVRLEDIQPATIRDTFPVSFPFVFGPGGVSAQRIAGVLRVLKQLAASGQEGRATFTVLTQTIQKKYPEFSLDRAVIQKRIDGFSHEYLSVHPVSRNDPALPDSYSIPAWILDSMVTLDGPFKDNFLRFVLFGDFIIPIYKTVVKKEAGFGATVGVARASKVVYNTASNSSAVIIFKGAVNTGELKLSWHGERKPELFITPVDMNKLGLNDGDSVNIVFHDTRQET